MNYDDLIERLKQGPVTFKEIQEIAGVSHKAVWQVITTLSLNYPLWSPGKGIYKLLEDKDYKK